MQDIESVAKRSPTHAFAPELVALGLTIRATRGKLGMSQEELANVAGVDRSYMGGIERGEHNLTVITLCRVSSAVGLCPSDLLKGSGL